MAVKWTTDLPSETGDYWWRLDSSCFPEVVRLYSDGTFFRVGCEMQYSTQKEGGEWRQAESGFSDQEEAAKRAWDAALEWAAQLVESGIQHRGDKEDPFTECDTALELLAYDIRKGKS